MEVGGCIIQLIGAHHLVILLFENVLIPRVLTFVVRKVRFPACLDFAEMGFDLSNLVRAGSDEIVPALLVVRERNRVTRIVVFSGLECTSFAIRMVLLWVER